MSNSGRSDNDNESKTSDTENNSETFQFSPIPINDVRQKQTPPDKLVLGIFEPIANPVAIPVNLENRNRLVGVENAPIFYQADALPSLLKTTPSSAINKNGERVVRFLLTMDNQLIFAREGAPSGEIPAHYQMANFDVEKAKCLTAGNAFFNEKGELCRLNHKSGDFRPSFDTLQFIMPLVIALGIPVASELVIDKLDKNGGLIKSIPLDTSLIKPERNPPKVMDTSLSLGVSSTAALMNLLNHSDSISFEKLPISPQTAIPAGNIVNSNDNDQRRYKEGIEFLINQLPSKSSTKKKYLHAIQNISPMEKMIDALVSLSTKTLKRHEGKKKEYSDHSTGIHQAIKETKLSDPYDKSPIARLILEGAIKSIVNSSFSDQSDAPIMTSVHKRK